MYSKGANLIHTIRHAINNDSLFRNILMGLNQQFYHQTVTTAQVENYISVRAGFGFQKVFDQYLRTTQIPVLNYSYNEKEKIFTYEYKNCVTGFNLPLHFTYLDKNYSLVDMIKLSKYHKDSYVDRKLIRKFYSYLYSFICKIFYGSEIKDYSTGIRFYNLRTVTFLEKNIKSFLSPIGLLDDLLLLINNNFIIKEMPFILTDRKFGRSFLTIKESLLCLYELILCILKNIKDKKKSI
jgi:hypothetical protein